MAVQDIILRAPVTASNIILSDVSTGLNIWINVSGTMRQVSEAYVNIAGSWKAISAVNVNVAGAWKVV